MLSVKTYGKLYIAGEYQVLEKQGIAIVLGLKRYMELTIMPNDTFCYQSDDLFENHFEYNSNELKFNNNNNNEIVKATINVAFNYLRLNNINITPFKINIVSNLESDNGKKYGFGSSSAIITGLIKVITKYFKLTLSNEKIFKLSVIAQITANKLTSGGDLAAAIFGTLILYQRYDLKWLLSYSNLYETLNLSWPDLLIEEIPTNLNFGAIWTKTSYHTPNIKLRLSKDSIDIAKDIVKNIKNGLIEDDYLNVYNGLINYQHWFNTILDSNEIITKEILKTLTVLDELNLSGKISGAGGGDSIIFMYQDNYDFNVLNKKLNENNLELINLEVSDDK